MKRLNIEENESNRKYAHRVIKASIMDYYFKPGQLVSEIETSKELGLSRTPIREALILLEEEKLLEVKPQKGTFVTHIDMKLVYSAIFIRQTLEKAIIAEACSEISPKYLANMKKNLIVQRALLELDEGNLELFVELDDKFHQYLYEGVGKGDVWAAIKKVSIPYNRLRHLDILEKLSVEKIVVQHQVLLDIIEARSLEKIGAFVEQHLTNIVPKINYIQEKYPTYFV
ncbi:MAG: GntR family transcriptional regulator [Culicoidibacterales bacterium]